MHGDEARQQYNERLRQLEHERMARQLQRLPQPSSLITRWRHRGQRRSQTYRSVVKREIDWRKMIADPADGTRWLAKTLRDVQPYYSVNVFGAEPSPTTLKND